MDAAQKFAAAPPADRIRKGPPPRCDIYGPGDPDLYRILHDRRINGNETWIQVQQVLDAVLGVATPIKSDLFRYHWSGKCGHWDGIELPR